LDVAMLLQVLPVPVFFVSILSALVLPNLIADLSPTYPRYPNRTSNCPAVVLSYLSPLSIVLFNSTSPPPVYRAA
jgi:hypothetical protein